MRAVTINEHGTMLVDLAEAEQLLAGMSVEQQLQVTNIIFEPILQNAIKMRDALQSIKLNCSDQWAADKATEALPT